MKRCTALVVNSDRNMRNWISGVIADAGCEVEALGTLADAKCWATTHVASVVLLELYLRDGSGWELFPTLLGRRYRDTRIVVLTAYPSAAAAVHAMKMGVDDFLYWPVSGPELIDAVTGEDAHPRRPQRTIPSLHEIEREYIGRVVTKAGGNITLAARMLGLHRQSLQRKLRRFSERRATSASSVLDDASQDSELGD